MGGADAAGAGSGHAPALSIVLTVVDGPPALRRCLDVLQPQTARVATEIIVPYDRWCADVGELAGSYPDVQFVFIADLGPASAVSLPRDHALYDRRRAVGLARARGRLVAMTEDRSIPAADWCERILAVHEQPYAAIGGAIDNRVDRPMNWALYYCDFGRYGRPLEDGPAAYVSDVNVAYKRAALEAIGEVWRESYHETTVHWALQARGATAHGATVFLDSRMVVYQHRAPMSLRDAFRERIAFARGFAATRVAACTTWQRVLYAAGTPLLPALLLARVARHMRRQGRSRTQMAQTLPVTGVLLTGWALGELLGYVAPRPLEFPRVAPRGT